MEVQKFVVIKSILEIGIQMRQIQMLQMQMLQIQIRVRIGIHILHNLDFPLGGVPQAREIIRKDNSIISIMKDNLHFRF